MNPSSMIVFQIDVDGIAFDPAKCNAPVSVGTDRITAFIAGQRGYRNERIKLGVQGKCSVCQVMPYSHASPGPGLRQGSGILLYVRQLR